MTDME